MAEYLHFDGETFITIDIIFVDEKKQEVELAITNRGRIIFATYNLYMDRDGKYFEYGCMYEKIYLKEFKEM